MNLQEFEDMLLTEAKKPVSQRIKKSVDWFRDQLSGFSSFAKGKALGAFRYRSAESYAAKLGGDAPVEIGSMYLMSYPNPKHKQTLKYWDMFPLVFPFRVEQNVFALNLHYISPSNRAELLKRLIVLKNTETLTENTRLKLSWQVLNNVSRFPEVKPTVHQYIPNRIRFSKLVPVEDWPLAIYLPLSRWNSVKSKPTDRMVYTDSGL